MLLGSVLQKLILVGFFCGQRTSGKWDVFKSARMRVQGIHVPVRVKGKADWSKGP